MSLSAHGIALELPRGWSGRVFRRHPGATTVHVANYALALNDGEFGDRSTAHMTPGGCFIALNEYRPGRGLRPGAGLFAAQGLRLPLDPARFSERGLAHPRPGQVGAQQFFSAAGRPFCLYVVMAGARGGRRRQLAHADHVLRTLHISAL